MNKQQFVDALRKALYGLPTDDVNKSLQYYSEMIDDRIEDGLSEYDAIAAMASPQEIAKQILMDIPLPKLVRAKAKPRHTLRAWEIVLLVLGSPIWFSLGLAVAAVVLSVYIVLWSVIISLYSVAVSFVACAVGGVISGVMFIFFGKYAAGVFLLGAGILVLGLGILMFIGCNYATKGIVWLSRKIWLFIKSCFVKGDAK